MCHPRIRYDHHDKVRLFALSREQTPPHNLSRAFSVLESDLRRSGKSYNLLSPQGGDGWYEQLSLEHPRIENTAVPSALHRQVDRSKVRHPRELHMFRDGLRSGEGLY